MQKLTGDRFGRPFVAAFVAPTLPMWYPPSENHGRWGSLVVMVPAIIQRALVVHAASTRGVRGRRGTYGAACGTARTRPGETESTRARRTRCELWLGMQLDGACLRDLPVQLVKVAV